MISQKTTLIGSLLLGTLSLMSCGEETIGTNNECSCQTSSSSIVGEQSSSSIINTSSMATNTTGSSSSIVDPCAGYNDSYQATYDLLSLPGIKVNSTIWSDKNPAVEPAGATVKSLIANKALLVNTTGSAFHCPELDTVSRWLNGSDSAYATTPRTSCYGMTINLIMPYTLTYQNFTSDYMKATYNKEIDTIPSLSYAGASAETLYNNKPIFGSNIISICSTGKMTYSFYPDFDFYFPAEAQACSGAAGNPEFAMDTLRLKMVVKQPLDVSLVIRDLSVVTYDSTQARRYYRNTHPNLQGVCW